MSPLVVQWLRLPTTTAEGTGLILCWGTKNPCGMWHGQKEKEIGEKKENCCWSKAHPHLIIIINQKAVDESERGVKTLA